MTQDATLQTGAPNRAKCLDCARIPVVQRSVVPPRGIFLVYDWQPFAVQR